MQRNNDPGDTQRPPVAPSDEDAFEKWERENASAKVARRRDGQ